MNVLLCKQEEGGNEVEDAGRGRVPYGEVGTII
jgi:hypothetical protein